MEDLLSTIVHDLTWPWPGKNIFTCPTAPPCIGGFLSAAISIPGDLGVQ
jgi:hypothetical protein